MANLQYQLVRIKLNFPLCENFLVIDVNTTLSYCLSKFKVVFTIFKSNLEILFDFSMSDALLIQYTCFQTKMQFRMR